MLRVRTLVDTVDTSWQRESSSLISASLPVRYQSLCSR
uniref:Uncharacterized protein n=1 Tax=Anguilla anguilla TaxID=7936 RepID=A0A0E9Q3I8_ANGAN